MWLVRNELVFDRKWPTINTLLFHSKMRGLVWVRAIQNELRIQESSWWLRPFKILFNFNKSGVGGRLWSPLMYEWVKFNISGVTKRMQPKAEGC